MVVSIYPFLLKTVVAEHEWAGIGPGTVWAATHAGGLAANKNTAGAALYYARPGEVTNPIATEGAGPLQKLGLADSLLRL